MSDPLMKPLRFLVADPSPVIAEDLASLLAESAPSAQILIAQTPDAALDHLADAPALTAAFVNFPRSELHGTGLIERIEALRGAFVTLWAEDAAQFAHWLLLDIPFTGADVAGVLRRLG